MVSEDKSMEYDDAGREILGVRVLEGKVDGVLDGVAAVTMYDDRGRALYAKSMLSELEKAGIGANDRFTCTITRHADGASVSLKPIPRLTTREWTQLIEENRRRFGNIKLPDSSM